MRTTVVFNLLASQHFVLELFNIFWSQFFQRSTLALCFVLYLFTLLNNKATITLVFNIWKGRASRLVLKESSAWQWAFLVNICNLQVLSFKHRLSGYLSMRAIPSVDYRKLSWCIFKLYLEMVATPSAIAKCTAQVWR